MGANGDGKEVDPGLDFFHGMDGAEDGDEAADAGGSAHDGGVDMARDEGEKDLQDSAADSGEEINSEESTAAEDFLDATAKKVNAQAVKEDVPRHGGGMEKLKGEQLPDFSVEQSIAGKGQMSVDINVAVKKESALNEKAADQNKDQPGGKIGRVVRVPHVKAVADGHSWQGRELSWKGNSGVGWGRIDFNRFLESSCE